MLVPAVYYPGFGPLPLFQAPDVTITYTPTTSGSLGGRRGGTRRGNGSGGTTTARVKDALSNALTVSGRQARLSRLVTIGGVSTQVKLPGAGKLVVHWYVVTENKRTLVALGSLTSTRAASKTLRIHLTETGVDRLRKAKRVTLTLTGSFTPRGQKAVTATTTRTFDR